MWCLFFLCNDIVMSVTIAISLPYVLKRKSVISVQSVWEKLLPKEQPHSVGGSNLADLPGRYALGFSQPIYYIRYE